MSAAATVYRAFPEGVHPADADIDEVVEVTVAKPEDFGVLYELHPVAGQLEETDREGVFRVRWGQAMEWPYQITAK